MGQIFSCFKGGSTGKRASKYEVQESLPSSPVAPAPKPKLDPKDFMFRDKKGEKLIKPPGSINGQQFVLDTCEAGA